MAGDPGGGMDWPRSLSGAIPEVSSHGPTRSPDLLKGNTPQPPERGTGGILPLSTEWLLPFGDKTLQGNYLFDKDSRSTWVLLSTVSFMNSTNSKSSLELNGSHGLSSCGSMGSESSLKDALNSSELRIWVDFLL